MSKELILVIDDETHILELVKYNLEKEGYRVTVCETGEEGLEKTDKEQPDLVILDLMLPGMDGLDVCKRIRRNNTTTALPILMLTARGEEIDKVLGLETGADDYLTKPFGIRELTARVKALLRRSSRSPDEPEVIRAGNLTIDTGAYRVYKDEQEVELTSKEYELLKELALNRGRILTRDYLLDKVWGYDFFGNTRTVDVHVRHLRKKIEEDDKNPRYIQTSRGIGYSFNYKGDEDA
ncbi:MAG: response regulator transcription factor [Bacillota bacterium]|nr:response regulator transcription factor [Bacillota bacterium]MDD3298049.1 response regulator transcription factor [Bacillota bacterium]MDD3850499.1 response regulator transcription factor [Bacillota bacterium]MDD4707729.1 response regulator transcription factor [Bacillota bacterium]